MSEPKPGEHLRITRLGDLLEEWEIDAQASYEAKQSGKARGPLSGLPKLDRELGGCFMPGMHIIHGEPGAGKTALALQIAGECGCPALLVSCEMGTLELFRRTAARVTGTFLGKFKSGELTPAESLSHARRAAAACPQLVIADATRDWASPEWLRDVAEVARGSSPHLLMVVDSVHSWVEGSPIDAPEYDALNAGLSALRVLSKTLDCPILAVAERNRASMKGGGISAGAGSRKIEYGAETVLGLSREEKTDANGELEVKLHLPKNRNGTPGKTIPLRFNGATQSFREMPW